jgi:hypothetical protein
VIASGKEYSTSHKKGGQRPNAGSARERAGQKRKEKEEKRMAE